MALSLVIFLAVLQGASELFPVSSLGHSVVVPALFHLNVSPGSDSFVPFLTLLHLGTAAALLVLYRKDWVRIIAAFFRTAVRGQIRNDTERLAMLILAGTVPTAMVGVAAETPVKKLFAKPSVAAGFLIANGVMLAGAELLRRRAERRVHAAGREAQEKQFGTIGNLTFGKAIAIGLAQVLAFLPGISRSGATLSAGLLGGLRHEEALRFGFLLSTPLIGGAGLIEVPQLFGSGAPLGTYLLGAVAAGVVAYASAKFLIRYFHIGRLDPFAGYCVALGLVTLVAVR
jgi:undecaprenyl-diphosphatase